MQMQDWIFDLYCFFAVVVFLYVETMSKTAVPGSVFAADPNVIFDGRLAEYKYYDMAPAIELALRCFE